MRYKAFISYSHADDAFATRLHERLERYRLPQRLVTERQLSGNRLGVIFRDRDELASSSSLTETIREALADSECLIVLCSPDSAVSHWVNAEIDAFRTLRPDGAILPMVPDSVPEAPLGGLFPESLRRGEEPLAADARPDGDGFQRAFLKLAASLAGVRFDELRRREVVRRRQRFAGIAAGAVLGASVVGTLIYQAHVAEKEAVERKAQAQALISYMVEDLDKRLQEYEEVGELDQGLSQALNYFAALDADDLDDDTLHKYRVALIGVGSVRLRQGKLEQALENFQRAVQLGEVYTSRADTDPTGWYELAENTYYVGEAYWEMQNVATAAEHIQAALDYARKAAALAPDDVAYRFEVLYGLNNMGAIYTRLKRYPSAIASLESALEENDALRVRFPERLQELKVQEAESVSWLAEILPTLGDYEQGFVWHERELSLREQLFEETGNIHQLARLSDALGYYARTLSALGRDAEARAALERSNEITARLIREDPENALWSVRGQVGRILLAMSVFHEGDTAAAVNLLDRAEQGLQNLLAEDRSRDMATLHVAYIASCRAYFGLDRPEQALEYLEHSFEILEPRLGEDEGGETLGYYTSAVILDAAARRDAGKAPDTARIERAVTLLRARGEPDQSMTDAAALGLLELAGDLDDRGLAEFDLVTAKGYRARFFLRMRELLSA